MFGFSPDKVVVILFIVAFVIGPQRLPQYAARLAQLIKRLRVMADSAQERVREELGPEFEDLDWKKLDPRQYDPRQIIRDSLIGEGVPSAAMGGRLPNPFDDMEPARPPTPEGHDSAAPVSDPAAGG